MAKDRPWYKRYPSNFIHGTMHMELEQKGAYSVVLDLIYDKGGAVMDDPQFLSRMCGCSVRKWKSIRDYLVADDKLYEKDGFLRNKLADDLTISEDIQARNLAENGAKGSAKTNEKRAQSKKDNDLAKNRPTGNGRQAARHIRDQRLEDIPNGISPLPPKGGKEGLGDIELPVWLPRQTWQDFVEFRKGIRAPLTDKAAKLAITELTKMQKQGHDPVAVVNQSILNNWKGLFAPKGDLNVRSSTPTVQGGQRHQPKASYVDKVQAAASRAKEHVDRQLDADRDMPWNREDRLGAPQGQAAISDGSGQAVPEQSDLLSQGGELEGSEL